MDEFESYFEITIERHTPYKNQYGNMSVRDETLYRQRVDFISIKQLSALINEVDETGRIGASLDLKNAEVKYEKET